jgi:hypothetical protein
MYGVLAGLSLTGLVTTYVRFGMGSAHKPLVNLLNLLVSVHIVAALGTISFIAPNSMPACSRRDL